MHIDAYSFGRITIDGVDYTSDVIILPDGVRSPWWRAAGGHVYAPGDLGPVLETAAEWVVLGTGCYGRVQVADATLEVLTAVGSEVVIEPTDQAVKTFNRLVDEGRAVVAALHLTC
jgi:hypothetical protein